MWPFKKNRESAKPEPVREPEAEKKPQDAKPEAKKERELPSVEWTHVIGDWRKEEVCEHCGHTWPPETDHIEDPCPTCGCIGSHKAQVVREEYDKTQLFYRIKGDYPSAFLSRGIDVGVVVDGWDGFWRGIRNRKTVIWDGCSVKKEEAKHE